MDESPILLVASGGGHLKQLHCLYPRLELCGERIWVTFDTPLSRSLLVDEDVRYVPYAHPHDATGTLRALHFAAGLLRSTKPDRIVSTGANLAVAFLPLGHLWGARCQYIESATRSTGPSLTGRILQHVAGIERYTQHESWAGPRWRYGGSLFDGFAPRRQSERIIRRLVVTVGINESFGFRRLIERLVKIVPQDVEVLWQTGTTETGDLPIAGMPTLDGRELESAVANADAVVAHAGTGSALTAFERGKMPVLIPRRAKFREHIDDHQVSTASDLERRGLATTTDVETLEWPDIVASTNTQIVTTPASTLQLF